MSLKKLTKASILALALLSASFSYAIDEAPVQDNFISIESPRADAVSQNVVSANLEKVASAAKELLGTRYSFGGTNPESGFDCSGFVRYVFKEANIELPRSSYDMKKIGTPVDVKSLKIGDLLFFKINTSHVGIYGKRLLSARRIVTAE